MSFRMAHISDLHFASGHFREDWWIGLLGIMDDLGPDLVIVTGDLTMDGHVPEYERAASFLKDMKWPMLVVPGNHDSMNQGHVIFKEMFGTRKPYFENDAVVVQGLDSSMPDLHEGEIGRHNYPLISKLGDKDKVRIVAMHHHAIPVPGTGRELNILMDSGDFLRTCMDSGVNAVLSGHRHLPWVWNLQGIYFITAGTACTSRLKGRSHPSFNSMEIENGDLSVSRFDVDTGERVDLIGDGSG